MRPSLLCFALLLPLACAPTGPAVRGETAEGVRVPLDVDTICIHGDTRGASQLAQAVRTALEHAGVTVAPLA